MEIGSPAAIEQINSIDLTEYAGYVIEDEFRNYYLGSAGSEHYKLLAYLSTQYSDSSLLDIGTYKGCSSLAMAYNKSNKVKSFDIREGLRRLSNYPDNVEYIVDNILEGKYKELVMESPLILLDTDHEGGFEHEFYQYLRTIQWKGTLVLDDIYYNQPMTSFWNSIEEEKQDLTAIGHHSGTGIVFFK